MSAHQEKENRSLAVKVVRELWPGVMVDEMSMTPELALYAFTVLMKAAQAHKLVKALGAPLSVQPATSWAGLSLVLVKAVRGYTSSRKDWGLAVRAAVKSHERHVKNHLMYGPETYPLPTLR